MIELKYKSGPFGDETSNYTVETDAVFVVQFIEQVLKERDKEWGTILLSKEGSWQDEICVCEYRYGKIIRRASEYDSYGIAKIKSIFANGGWSAMNYTIQIEDYDKFPEQSREEYLQVYFGRKA